MIALALFVACQSDGPADDPSDDTGAVEPAGPFVETLDPHVMHVLATSTPAPGDPGHAVTELSVTLDVQWAVDLDPGAGTAGAVRFENGDTVYVRSSLPPNFVSALERVDAAGALVWSQDAFFSGALSFAHGVVLTPDGDYVIADPIVSRVFGVSEAGEVLWELPFRSDAGTWHPNGLDLQTDAEGVTRIALSELVAPDSRRGERVEVYRLGGRTDTPTLEWSFEGGVGTAERLWPHGPRFMADGSVLVSWAALGQLARVEGGTEDWRVPEEPGVLAFPRDAVVLPDGSWLVADAAQEVLRVHDPLGAFEIVDAAYVPGVFGLTAVTCGSGGGLPCLQP
ncbi:MAG: hypothetical protein V4850_34160 [Myxococcota bacterium]